MAQGPEWAPAEKDLKVGGERGAPGPDSFCPWELEGA